MSEDPIYTKVKNNCSIEKVLYWAGDDSIVVPANGETTVPFEIWSRADSGQRESMRAEIADGTIELTVGVQTAVGEFSEARFVPCDKTLTEKVAPVETSPAAEVKVLADMAEEKDHIIIAKTDTTEASKDFYSVKVENTETVEHLDAGGAGFVSAPVEKATDTPAEDAGETSGEDDIEDQYNRFVESKSWNEALALLKKKFGDKVNFGIRALISAKDYKTIVERYKLD